MYKKSSCSHAVLSGLMPLTFFFGAAASAQQTAPSQGQNADSSQQVEEIVVTAEKRQERLQDVPIAVQTVDSQQLADNALTNSEQLGELTPGLTINRVSSSAIITLRGIGNQNASVLGDEGATVLYVDGVYIPGSQSAVFDFNNIQQIEILKGPQGTLFGRNATGGVVQIITQTPSQTPRVDFDIGYGNYATVTSNFYATSGITDNLAADLAVHVNEQDDGWGKNLATGKDEFTDHEIGLRSKWLLTLDDTTATLSVDYTHSRDEAGTAYSFFPGSRGVDPLLPAGPVGGFYDVDLNFPSVSDNKSYGGSLNVNHDLNWAHFVSISSYRNGGSNNFLDQDGTPLAISNAALYERETTWTEEAQLLSPSDSMLKWVAGFYYYNDRSGYHPLSLIGAGIPTGNLQIESHQDTNSYAGYGQATATVLPKTDLTLGLRYTVDQRHVEGALNAPNIPGDPEIVSGNQNAQFPKLTYRLSLDYHFSDDVLGYVSYNRGFKSGVFNVISPETASVRPEVLDAYEVGLHSELFDKTLRLNAAAFYYDFSDLQLINIVAGSAITTNAGSAEVKGVDLDFEAKPLPRLTLTGGLAYLDSSFTSYPDAPFYVPAPGGGDSSTTFGNAAGKQLPYAPKISFNIGASYVVPSEIGDFTGSVNYIRTDSLFVAADNLVKEPAYGLLNASVSWMSPTDTWELRVWGANLTDTHHYSYVTEQGLGNTASPAAPLTFGVTLGFHFAPEEAPVTAPPAAVAAPQTAAPPPAPAPEAQRLFQVFFDFDKSDLTDAAKQVVLAAATAVRGGNVVKISVIGHTDTVGTARYNQGLSERRAASVKRGLVADGVPEGEVATTGVGKSGLLVPTKDGVREPQNRRAEIELQ